MPRRQSGGEAKAEPKPKGKGKAKAKAGSITPLLDAENAALGSG